MRASHKRTRSHLIQSPVNAVRPNSIQVPNSASSRFNADIDPSAGAAKVALVMGFLSFYSFSNNVQADIVRDIPAQTSLVSPSVEDAAYAHHPRLFGMAEKRSTNLDSFKKWDGMLKRYETQIRDGSKQRALQEWKTSLEELRGKPLKEMASAVNDLMNKKPFISDMKNWGRSDYWATPVEFIERGGDCEDYAIAKYASLLALGVPEDRLRVAIVQDTYRNIPHAVLAVYTDEGILVLDNQIKEMVDADVTGRYLPIFSINSTAWWLHIMPETKGISSINIVPPEILSEIAGLPSVVT